MNQRRHYQRPPMPPHGLGDLERGERVGDTIGPGGPSALGSSAFNESGLTLPPAPTAAPYVNAFYQPQNVLLAAWTLQTYLVSNPKRRTLQIQNKGLGDLYILFQQITNKAQDNSGNQALQTAYAQKSLWLVAGTATAPGGSYEAYVPPNDAVTLLTLGTGTNAVIIEGG